MIEKTFTKKLELFQNLQQLFGVLKEKYFLVLCCIVQYSEYGKY
jgi:hypothetical protein